MKDERFQQVLNIEEEARKIHDAADRDSEQILISAEQEVGWLIENARTEAQKEAREIVTNAQAKDESARILAEAEETIKRAKSLSEGNLEKAVRFVLDQTIGKG
jgi:F0F1-type ATP synthase membrane subunit b/b'